MKKIILGISLLLMITGCGSRQPVYQVVYKTKTVYLKPSDELLKYEIDLPSPPDKELYVEAKPIQREQMLGLYIIDLLKVIKKYKVKEENIINWYKIDNNSSRGN